jgi:hypothetical protein
MLANMMEQMKGKSHEQVANIDFGKIHEGVDKLPDQPDENLR